MNTEPNTNNYWIGKRAKLEIDKDGTRLFFTAEILALDNNSISFRDRYGVVYSYPLRSVQMMKEA